MILEEALRSYEPVIGLEVHAQLLTRSKIFCPAPAAFDLAHPNANVDAYCLGHPGVLPVLNREVVDMAIRAGLAVGCTINPTSVWARKHYFYPDLSKGYQISQYDRPICEHGHLDVPAEGGGTRRVHIARIHMEEDAGKSMHVEGAPYTLVDYNRAGVPLIEIVSGPDLRAAREASAYLKALRSILMTLGVNDGNMEEGSFRCDANVSIRPRGQERFGTRCEVKNINSFRFVEQAIEHEIVRHAKILSEGGAVEQETRLFDSGKKQTRPLRSKEEAHDYRYFPDPDLPPLSIPSSWIEEARARLPELPAAKVARWTSLGVPAEHAQTFAEEREVGAFFDAAVSARPALAVPIAHFVKGEVLREPASMKVAPAELAELVEMKERDRISSTQQKKMFGEMWRDGTPLAKLAAAAGEQLTDTSAIEKVVDEVLAKNAGEVEKLKKGKTNVMAFLIGQVMKGTGGKAKPQLVKELVERKLS